MEVHNKTDIDGDAVLARMLCSPLLYPNQSRRSSSLCGQFLSELNLQVDDLIHTAVLVVLRNDPPRVLGDVLIGPGRGRKTEEKNKSTVLHSQALTGHSIVGGFDHRIFS